ncbi:c-type cytochrome [Helicobacter mesocricetorum]|uniref:c-type cytochrome n=1 Tax=Helicobacter mesocricetorum TaxID=87012 RepID=UPI0018F7FFF2|nr:c-type cytochrome [Helicobacter mesocricetorum]
MKKFFLLAVLCLSFLNAEDCICFELKGEFGEEIKAILKKYSKNLDSKDIQIIREDADLTTQEKSFLESLIGTGKVDSSNKRANLENGEKLFQRDCATCHGKNAEVSIVGKPSINTWKAADIADELKSYQNQTFQGQSRFIKNQIAQRYTKKDMEDIGYYIETLR